MNNDKNNESKTLGTQKRTRFTSRLDIKCDPEVKEIIKKFAEDNGLSLCHIFDALIRGYIMGLDQQLKLGTQSPTINLTIEREVKRVRRYAREFREEPNKYDGALTRWVFEADAVLNAIGHAAGCACSECWELGR